MTTTTTAAVRVPCPECGHRHNPWRGTTINPKCPTCSKKKRNSRAIKAPQGGFNTLPNSSRKLACEDDSAWWTTAENICESRKTPWQYIAELIPEAQIRCWQCPLTDACAAAAVAERYSGIAGGTVWDEGTNLTDFYTQLNLTQKGTTRNVRQH